MPESGTYYRLGSNIANGNFHEKVGCYICGITKVTLYKDGDKRICRKCRQKKQSEG